MSIALREPADGWRYLITVARVGGPECGVASGDLQDATGPVGDGEIDELPGGSRRAWPPAAANAVRTVSAQSIWLAVGVKTSCRVLSCRGWIADLP